MAFEQRIQHVWLRAKCRLFEFFYRGRQSQLNDEASLNVKTADRYDVPDKADLNVLRALYNAAAARRLGANFSASFSGHERHYGVLCGLWHRNAELEKY